MTHDAMADLFRSFNDIFGGANVARRPIVGKYQTTASVTTAGIDWDAEVTYNATKASKAPIPRGEAFALEPDDPGELEVVTVHFIAFDNGHRMVPMPEPLEVNFSELDADQQCAIEEKCADDFDARRDHDPRDDYDPLDAEVTRQWENGIHE